MTRCKRPSSLRPDKLFALLAFAQQSTAGHSVFTSGSLPIHTSRDLIFSTASVCTSCATGGRLRVTSSPTCALSNGGTNEMTDLACQTAGWWWLPIQRARLALVGVPCMPPQPAHNSAHSTVKQSQMPSQLPRHNDHFCQQCRFEVEMHRQLGQCSQYDCKTKQAIKAKLAAILSQPQGAFTMKGRFAVQWALIGRIEQERALSAVGQEPLYMLNA